MEEDDGVVDVLAGLTGSQVHRLPVFQEQVESVDGEKEDTQVEALTKYLDDALKGLPSDDEEEVGDAKVSRDLDHLYQLLQHQEGKTADPHHAALRRYKDEPLWREEELSLLQHYTTHTRQEAPSKPPHHPVQLIKKAAAPASHFVEEDDLSDEEVRDQRLELAQKSTSTDELMAERQRVLTKIEAVQDDLQQTEVSSILHR